MYLGFDAEGHCPLICRDRPGKFFDQAPSLNTKDAVTENGSQDAMRYKQDRLSGGSEVVEYLSLVLLIQS
jgi:hypothetical protein